MQTILQVEESQFRNNSTTDKLMGFLRECENLIENNILTIRTNLMFDLNDPIVHAFNHQLRILQAQQTIMIQIKLD